MRKPRCKSGDAPAGMVSSSGRWVCPTRGEFNDPSGRVDALRTQIGGSHYRACDIQPVEFIEANGLGYLEGCCIKRLVRHDAGGKGVEDIDKAIHELQLLRELRYGQE